MSKDKTMEPKEYCESWIWIDGGNDQAHCSKLLNHEGKHKRYGVPKWTDADHASAEAADDW